MGCNTTISVVTAAHTKAWKSPVGRHLYLTCYDYLVNSKSTSAIVVGCICGNSKKATSSMSGLNPEGHRENVPHKMSFEGLLSHFSMMPARTNRWISCQFEGSQQPAVGPLRLIMGSSLRGSWQRADSGWEKFISERHLWLTKNSHGLTDGLILTVSYQLTGTLPFLYIYIYIYIYIYKLVESEHMIVKTHVM